jgi:hypothetical protein
MSRKFLDKSIVVQAISRFNAFPNRAGILSSDQKRLCTHNELWSPQSSALGPHLFNFHMSKLQQCTHDSDKWRINYRYVYQMQKVKKLLYKSLKSNELRTKYIGVILDDKLDFIKHTK